jgi:GrpB-like predicted nucleotidyltransferase (UPF0157 family)
VPCARLSEGRCTVKNLNISAGGSTGKSSVDYDQEWPERFARPDQIIRDAVGSKALSIEHIGSTALPGLAAKPITDILLTVQDVADETGYVSPLEGVGFVLRVREPGHRMFRTPSKDVHLHVFSSDSDPVPNYRDLRDWLRVDDSDPPFMATRKGCSPNGSGPT